jgi:hypothetical protein
MTMAAWKVSVRFLWYGVLIAISPTVRHASAAELVTGSAFRRALSEPVGAITWSEKPLRGALERLVETQHVAIMLDRRIDPDQRVDFTARDVALESIVQAIAQRHQAAVCQVGAVLYVGPAATTRVLPTLVAREREKTQSLSAMARSRLSQASAWSWPRMSTPRELVEQLEQEYRVKINGKENVPHDLWPAVQLPPLGFIEKLSLVLAGFHVTFELSTTGDSVRLAAMPSDAAVERRYTPRGDVAKLAEELTRQFPDAKISAVGRNLVVDGRAEVHDAVERLLAGQRVASGTRPTGSRQVFTLTLENKPVGGVMRALGKQLGRSVNLDDVKAQSRLTKEISVSVKEATLDELLRAVLEPAGLKFEIQGETIRVFD